MAQWDDSAIHAKSTINNGNQYTTNDQMSIEALNNSIENAFYAARVAGNAQAATNNGVSYNAQTATESEKAQARLNIGVTAIETIYDKDSEDANLNWGHTGGLVGGTSYAHDLTKYKKLIIYGGQDPSWSDRYGNVIVDLTKPYSRSGGNVYFGGTIYTAFYDGGKNWWARLHATVSADKTSIKFDTGYINASNEQATSWGSITKIEGVF